MKTYNDLMDFIHDAERVILRLKSEGKRSETKLKELKERVTGFYILVSFIYGMDMEDIVYDVGDYGRKKEKQKLN